MKRLWSVVLGAALVTACRVERTPAEYIDHNDPIAVVREGARDEIQDRVLAVGQALGRGNPTEALTALSPAQDAYILLTGDSVLTGSGEIAAALRGLAATRTGIRVHDVEVVVGPRANVAWFHGVLELAGRAPEEDATLHVTGVYVLDEGLWELVQAHVSRRVIPPPPPSPDAAPDSVGAG